MDQSLDPFSVTVITRHPSKTSISGTSEIVFSVTRIAGQFATASNWNDYVQADDGISACVTSNTGFQTCLHGGEKKKVQSNSLSSCTGLTAKDSADAFYWVCDSGTNPIQFKTTTLKPGKSLKDLMSSSGWKDMQVTIYSNNQGFEVSTPTAWWSNTISPLPDSSSSAVVLSIPGVIYYYDTDQTSFGYNINEQSVGIVGLNNATLKLSSSAVANTDTNGENSGSNSMKVLISMGTQHFAWIEGDFEVDGTTGFEGLYLNLSNFGQIKNYTSRNFQRSINFGTVKNWQVRDVYILGTSGQGILTDSLSYSYFESITIIGQNFSGYGFSLGDVSNYNLFIDIFSKTIDNFYIFSSTANTVINTTFIGGKGIDIFSKNQHLYLNSVIDGPQAIYIFDGSALSKSVIANAAIDTNIIFIDSSYNLKFEGSISLNINLSCSVSGTNVGLTNSTCNLQSPSTGNQVSVIDFSSSFNGIISSDDSVNSQDDYLNGSLYDNLTEWNFFENHYRYWVNGSLTPCWTGEQCYIYDIRPKPTDTAIRNVTADFVNQNDVLSAVNQPCPAAVDGNVTITDQFPSPRTFLLNAREIINDEIGNENGVCESNEACIYSPNVGAYQGQGDFYSNQCAFSDGSVITGVKMYVYPEN